MCGLNLQTRTRHATANRFQPLLGIKRAFMVKHSKHIRAAQFQHKYKSTISSSNRTGTSPKSVVSLCFFYVSAVERFPETGKFPPIQRESKTKSLKVSAWFFGHTPNIPPQLHRNNPPKTSMKMFCGLFSLERATTYRIL